MEHIESVIYKMCKHFGIDDSSDIDIDVRMALWRARQKPKGYTSIESQTQGGNKVDYINDAVNTLCNHFNVSNAFQTVNKAMQESLEKAVYNRVIDLGGVNILGYDNKVYRVCDKAIIPDLIHEINKVEQETDYDTVMCNSSKRYFVINGKNRKGEECSYVYLDVDAVIGKKIMENGIAVSVAKAVFSDSYFKSSSIDIYTDIVNVLYTLIFKSKRLLHVLQLTDDGVDDGNVIGHIEDIDIAEYTRATEEASNEEYLIIKSDKSAIKKHLYSLCKANKVLFTNLEYRVACGDTVIHALAYLKCQHSVYFNRLDNYNGLSIDLMNYSRSLLRAIKDNNFELLNITEDMVNDTNVVLFTDTEEIFKKAGLKFI